MDSRAQFEAWFKQNFHYADQHLQEGRFGSEAAQITWHAWQASRAAIEVKLPSYRDATTHGFSAFNDALDLCENEISKQGISIKEELPLQHEAKEG